MRSWQQGHRAVDPRLRDSWDVSRRVMAPISKAEVAASRFAEAFSIRPLGLSPGASGERPLEGCFGEGRFESGAAHTVSTIQAFVAGPIAHGDVPAAVADWSVAHHVLELSVQCTLGATYGLCIFVMSDV